MFLFRGFWGLLYNLGLVREGWIFIVRFRLLENEKNGFEGIFLLQRLGGRRLGREVEIVCVCEWVGCVSFWFIGVSFGGGRGFCFFQGFLGGGGFILYSVRLFQMLEIFIYQVRFSSYSWFRRSLFLFVGEFSEGQGQQYVFGGFQFFFSFQSWFSLG